MPIDEEGQYLGAVMQGHLDYYAVPGNHRLLAAFRNHVSILWSKACEEAVSGTG